MKKSNLVKLHICSALAVSAAIAVPSSAYAQVEEIVVTARKTAENVQDVPVAITAVDAGLIEDRSMQDITDLERVAPNLYFQTSSQNSTGTLVSMRGINSTETLLVSQPAVGIYVDGIYQATTMTAGAMDAFDVSGMEVLKGPQGTLYGRNSTGGAVLIHTRRPEFDEFSADMVFRAGNYQEYQGQAAINIPLGSAAAVRVVGGYRNRGKGFAIDRRNNTQLDDLETYNFRAALRVEPADGLEITLRGDVSHLENSGDSRRLVGMSFPSAATPTAPGAAATAAALQYGFLTFADLAGGNPVVIGTGLARGAAEALSRSRRRSFDYDPGVPTFEKNNVHGFSATVAYDLSDDVTLQSMTAWRGFDFDYANECCDASAFTVISNAPDAFPVNRSVLDTKTPAAKFKQFSQELQLTGKAIDGRLNYAAGVYYFNSDGRDLNQPLIFPGISTGTLSVTDNEVSNESLSGYAQASFEVVDNLRVTAGLRYTDETVALRSRNATIINAQTPTPTTICDVPVASRINGQCVGDFTNKFSDTSYAFGLDYRVNDDVLLYVRTGNGFKAGGVNPRGGNTSINFAPEDVTDYEIGFKSDLFDRRLRLNVAAFKAQYKGFQQVVVFSPPGGGITSAILNADATGKQNRVDISGLEIDMVAKPVDGLTLTAAYGLVSPKFKAGLLPANLEKKLAGTPENSFNASISYEFPVSSNSTLSFYGGVSWLDDIHFQPNNGLILADGTKFAADASIQKAYALVDARITLDFEKPDLAVSLFARNLTNKYYFSGAIDLAGSLGPIVANEGEPRQWGIELSASF